MNTERKNSLLKGIKEFAENRQTSEISIRHTCRNLDWVACSDY